MPTPTADQIVGALLYSGVKWTTPSITFSIPTSGSTWPGYGPSTWPSSADYGVLNAVQADNFRLAMDAWARLIAVPVVETNDVSSPGEIRVAFSKVEFSGTGLYPPRPDQTTDPTPGDVWLDRATFIDRTFSPADSGEDHASATTYFVLMHEIGHALGLKHPHEGDATLPLPWANARYTLMAYDGVHDSEIFSFSNTGGEIVRDISTAKIRTPMVFDVLAIQSQYGSNTSDLRDTTYSWAATKDYLATIYDAGGNDTLDLGGHARASSIDLTPGAYSSIDYWTLEQQKTYWLDLFPSGADIISKSFDEDLAKTYAYTWRDNLGIAYGTVIENVTGGSGDDTVTGNEADNRLSGNAGDDRLFGGLGCDTLSAGEGSNYLRGDDGDDTIAGGSGFDDINGNMGNDTASGGVGDDWVVGGKDNDSLFGDGGGDIVWGNLGNDTLDGGDSGDQVRGGQGDDVVSGGAGDDFVSGDRGNDTVTGGTGADLFHGSQDAGIDRVTDFNLTEGDRVMLDPGTTYAVSQVGADTVIDMGGGHQMILVGVQHVSFTPGWIFSG